MNMNELENEYNKLINLYKRLKIFAEESIYKDSSIDDFIRARDNYNNKIKQLDEQINALEKGNRIREQSRIEDQIRKIGIIDSRNSSKSIEQINLEKERLSYEEDFQELDNIIIKYNIVKEKISNLDFNDLLKYVSECNDIINQANQSNLPSQLLVKLMEEKRLVPNNKQEIKEQPIVSSDMNSEEDKESSIFDIREKTINKKFADTGEKLKEAMDNDDEEEIVRIRMYRQQLLKELNQINSERIKESRLGEIIKLERLLDESNKRLEKINFKDDDKIFEERIIRQKVLDRLYEIEKDIKVKPVASEKNFSTYNKKSFDNIFEGAVVEETPLEDEKTFKVSNSFVKGEEDFDVKYGLVGLSLNEQITKLEKIRKRIDSEIIKIDLNAKWEGTPELMKEYYIISKAIEKKNAEINNQVVEEEINDSKSEKRKRRVPRFRKMLTETIPKILKEKIYSVRKYISNIIAPKEEISVSNDILEESSTDENSKTINNKSSKLIEGLEKMKELIKKEEEETSKILGNHNKRA